MCLSLLDQIINELDPLVSLANLVIYFSRIIRTRRMRPALPKTFLLLFPSKPKAYSGLNQSPKPKFVLVLPSPSF